MTQRKVKQIPYPLLWDKMPVDISYIFADEKPAGKHGFLKQKGEKLVFEDGTEARFWGTNFNSGANFPEHSHSEKVAKRLAQAGLNMVRLHQLDSEWSTPNIFQFSKGKNNENTLSFDEESMDRLDYLIYCLKREGIYIYMDFLTYRKFKTDDGVPNAPILREAGKPYSNYSRVLIELQKELNKKFLEHFNPYTECCYKDEPALALAEVTNENDFFVDRSRFCPYMEHTAYDPVTETSSGKIDRENFKLTNQFEIEPYATELKELYSEYAKGKGLPEEVDFNEESSQITKFLCKIQKDYYTEMIDSLRNNGAKFPITGTNWASDKATTFCNAITDFMDNHSYFWQGDQRGFMNRPHVKEKETSWKTMSMNFVSGKPLFISEWDVPWPNKWRADSTVMLAALGAFQGASGFTIHTYRYGTNESDELTKKIGRPIVIGNSYYRGTFDTYNDPAKFGLFYHAALITRRRDIKEAEETVEMVLNEEQVYNPLYDYTDFDGGICEKHKVRWCFDENKQSAKIEEIGNDIVSDTAEIFRDRKNGIGKIDAPKTKAVYGFIGEKTQDLDGVSIKIENDFATVAMSSLTDEPICESGNILLTAVGRADNKDIQYNEKGNVVIHEGTAPIMIDVIEGEISIKTTQNNLKVWSVDNEGYFTGIMKSRYEDGVFTFEIGKEFPSMYYLIQRQ